jgi:hypothetical protein
LDVSAGTLTLAAGQVGADKVGAGTFDAGTYSFTSSTISDLGSVTTADINGGTIDGATIATSDVTVGAGKTLDVSAGTLTLADDQISGDKVSGGTIGTVTISQLAGAMDANSQSMTNVNIDSGNIDGTAIGSTTPSTIAATMLEASQDATFNGANHLIYGQTSIHNDLTILDNATGTTTQFSVAEATGNTTIAGTLTVAGAIDANNDLDLDGTDVDVDATNDISLDAGAASNFSTSSGALTLEGAGGVTVTSTGGGLTLNGTGQTVDLDATTLDVDATTITVDATTTTFTGDVKGPKATADDEFVTYEQLDSLANTAPYNETYKAINLGTVATQTITVGPAVRLNLTGAPGYYYDNSYSVDNPSAGADPAYTTETSGGPGAAAGGGTQFVNLAQSGVYEAHLTMELAPIGTATADAKVLVEILNNDPAPPGATPNPMTIASDTEIVYFSDFGGGSCHLNLSMIFITENADEDVYVDITTIGEDVVVESFKFSLTRIGDQ